MRAIVPTNTSAPNHELLAQSLFRLQRSTIDGLIVDELPNRGTQRSMQPGRCVNLDGTDDYVDCGTGLITTGDFTTSLWIRPPSLADVGFFGMGAPYLTSGIGIVCYMNTNASLYILIADGVGVASNAGGILTAGAWHHIVLTVDRAGYAITYINNTVIFSTDVTSVTGSLANGSMYFGRYGSSTDYNYLGKMFDFQIFPKVISPAEVNQLYVLGCDALPNESRTGWWKLDEQHPTLAFDSSGNGHDGTLISVNATVGNFFYEGADVPHSYQNNKGYSKVGSVYYPRNEANKIEDTQSNALQHFGECPHNARLVQSNCLTLDGTDDHVAVTVDGSISSGEWSYSVWVNRNSSSGDYYRTIWSNNYVYLGVYIYEGKVKIFNAGITFDTTIPTGAWTHIVLTRDSDDLMRCYVNGVLETTTGTWTTEETASHTLQIGYDLQSGLGWYGNMLGFQAYASKISDADVLTLYQGGTISTTPYVHYLMAEGAGDKCYDIGPNALHGTITNADLVTCWATKQSVYHYNVVKGYSLYSHATLALLYVPYTFAGSPMTITSPSGYTKVADYPAGIWHNYAESKIDLTGGVAYPGSAGLSTAWHPNDGATNPQFFRLSTDSGINVRVDRCVLYDVALTGSRLVATNKFSTTKVL